MKNNNLGVANMNREEIAKTIIENLCELTGRDDITEEMNFESDIQITSVNAMRLSFNIENALNIDSFPQEIFLTVETVEDLINEVVKLV